jgi:hypothetical protein
MDLQERLQRVEVLLRPSGVAVAAVVVVAVEGVPFHLLLELFYTKVP